MSNRIERTPTGAAVLATLGLLNACNGSPSSAPAEPAGGSGSYVAGGAPGAPVDPARDVGTKAIHRLSNFEYDNTVRDLLGTSLSPAQRFVVEQTEDGFDNLAEALAVGARQYSDYFSAAQDLVDDVFSSPALLARIVPGGDADACDSVCANAAIVAFGAAAFRRPLEAWESELFSKKYQEAVALGEGQAGALAQVLRIVLISPQFLYRFEFDDAPLGRTPRALNPYELASRLSYMLWASTPDQALFDLAATGKLQAPEELAAQVDRMLGDASRSASLSSSFAGQWLHTNKLDGHSADPAIFPDWDPALRTAMQQELKLFFEQFLYEDRPFAEFLTADVNFVDARLAQHYGFPAPALNGFTRTPNLTDPRAGFFGLAGFLTVSSKANRTSPIKRGNTVLDAILCMKLTVPANLVVGELPPLDETTTVRQNLDLHRANAACAPCHNNIDPLGLALEHFDGLGRYRTEYENGLPIDAVGALPEGTSFDGLTAMSQVLSQDPRFMSCAAQKVFTYSLGRSVADSQPYVDQIVSDWLAGTPTLRNLLKQLVSSEVFRFRRGSGEQ